MLSDSESDGEDIVQLTINEHYAKAYAHKKEREELAILKEKYGSDAELGDEDSEDSEDTTEDEEGEELTPAVDVAILRTLARIKRKDPGIYEAGIDVFEEEQRKIKVASAKAGAQKKQDKSKPLLMRQHILNSTLQAMSRSRSPTPDMPTHAEEQVALRKETISAFHAAIASDSEARDSEDDILVPREKTKDEIEREQEEYREFLAREVGEDIGALVTIDESDSAAKAENEEVPVEDEANKMAEKKKKRVRKGKDRKSKEVDDHEFLMNYILNRGWIDHSSRHVPTYDEVTSSNVKKSVMWEDEDNAGKIHIIGADSSGGEGNSTVVPVPNDFDEEEFDEVAETFESSYNFRFEEPDAATIPTHPRDIASAVRREENPRKAARERKRARQEEKLLQKKEEVKRLKALKMKEIKEKLERIGREGGKSADDEALAQLDLDGDWDPDAYDRQMAGIYGNDEDGEEDASKPVWDDDIDIADIVPLESEHEAGPSLLKKKKDRKKKKSGTAADDDEGVDVDMMDVDLIDAEDDDSKGGPSSKGRKLPESELNELYALEFNSLVGDLPTRFKYMPVLPQSYGLTPAEVLLADDADLNEYVGLRKVAAPYRRDKGRTWDAKRGEKIQELRRKLGATNRGSFVQRAGEGGDEGERQAKKRKGKKERQKAKLALDEDGTGETRGVEETVDVDQGPDDSTSSKKRKRRHKKTSLDELAT